MSYTYLLEQGEESSAGCFSDIPQSVLSNLNLTAEKSYFKDNETVSCQSSQSGMMSAPLTELRGEEKSMSSAEDSLAKTYQQQEREPGSQENEADSGERWPESLAKYDLNTHSWRTHQCLLFEDLTECLAIFPRWGMMHDGELWELAMSAHLIKENESGFLPDGINFFHTPNTTGLDGGSNSRKALKKRQEKFPTPTASDYKDQPTSKSWKEKGAVNYKLSNPEIRRMWGTPKAQDSRHALTDRGKSNLGEQVAGLHNGGKLNPNWVEWLMGWPIGWTDLKPLEMDKFHLWLQQHGEYLEENK